jgi:hypothetical protein
MKSARLLFVLGLAGASCQSALAQEARTWIGASDCHLAAVKPAPAQAPSWSGACKDGYADGKGVLEWHNKDGKTYRLQGSFVAGQLQGEGELHYPNGSVYTGTFDKNLPEGHAYVRYADGEQYEGGIHMGERDGPGEMLYPNGDDYKGQWRKGRRNGTGVMTYILGGRYEGEWRDGEWSGRGKLVYAGGGGREVDTVDGYDPNRKAVARPDQTYTVKEDEPHTGTMLKHDIALSIQVPPTLGYDQLTPEQQAVVKDWYPALAPGDEPPYPLHGTAEFYKAMSRVIGMTGAQGVIHVYVLVGKDGKALNVRAIGLDDPAVRKVVATAAGIVQYKPARCAGQACEMTYPYNLSLTVEH